MGETGRGVAFDDRITLPRRPDGPLLEEEPDLSSLSPAVARAAAYPVGKDLNTARVELEEYLTTPGSAVRRYSEEAPPVVSRDFFLPSQAPLQPAERVVLPFTGSPGPGHATLRHRGGGSNGRGPIDALTDDVDILQVNCASSCEVRAVHEPLLLLGSQAAYEAELEPNGFDVDNTTAATPPGAPTTPSPLPLLLPILLRLLST